MNVLSRSRPRVASILSTAAVLLLGLAGAARADFTVDPNPGGAMFFNGDANKGVTAFVGTVGGQNSGPAVTVTTLGAVDTGAGFSNIKPVKGGVLPSLTFTPLDPTLFGDFSFRGQLLDAADGTVTVTVQDNQNNAAQMFTFTGLGANADFGRVGIVSLNGETIRSVTLTSDFKEEKQNEFSLIHGGAVPEPSQTASLGLGAFGLLGLMVRARRRRSTEA